MWFEMKVVQGSDYEATFSAKDPVTGAPIDIRTGFTFIGKICLTTDNDEAPLYSFPVGEDGLLPQNGSLVVRTPGDVSEDWTFERVVFGIRVLDTVDGRELMGIRGPCYVQPTVA
jgi:hypothetical protein